MEVKWQVYSFGKSCYTDYLLDSSSDTSVLCLFTSIFYIHFYILSLFRAMLTWRRMLFITTSRER